MPRQGDEQPIQKEISPGIGRWQWSDGTPLTQDEVNQFGLRNAGNAGNFFGDVGSALGFVPNVADQAAPGASLQTGAADAQRDRASGLIAALQQQATTGDGAWQQSFADAVRQTKNAAQAMGQSDSRVGYGAALRNIGNAQSAADQRAVGDSEILRNQSKLDARNQLGDILGAQAQMDLSQSAEQARVERERRAANQASVDQSAENRKNTEKGIAGAFGFGEAAGLGMSDGGKVPGRAQVFGNDERNDTKPAMLSPGEIVIPRDIATAPDAPEQAARFVAAVKAGHDPQANGGDPRKFAEGGSTGIRPVTEQEAGGSGVPWLNAFLPHIGRNVMYNNLNKNVGANGGGTLDMTQYNQTASQQNQLASLFAGQAMGSGPSIVPAVTQRRMDDTIGAAQAAQTRGGVPAGDVMQAASAAGSDAAANAGRTAATEASQGQGAFGRALRQQRGQELQRASAEQQAGWQKTLADMGLSLRNQAELRGAIGAAGQGAAAFAGQGRGGYSANPDNLTALSDNPYPDTEEGWAQYEPEEQGGGLKSGLAFGGVVGMADGGEVEDELMLELQDSATRVPLKAPRGPRTETATEHAMRKYQEWDEESDGEPASRPPRKEKKKPTEQESRFAKAVRGVGEFMRKAAGNVRGMAEGGGVPDGGGRPFFDPYAFDVQRTSAPVVYVSPTPVPGTQPVSIGGAGGGGGSDIGAGGASGSDVAMGGAGGAGGGSGVVQMDRGSGGATGGPAGNQIPQHEAIQPRAERPAVAPALPAGVTPKGAAPVSAPAPAPTPAPGATKSIGAGMPRADFSKADAAARAAAEKSYDAENQAAAAAAELAGAEANAMESQVNERKAVVERTKQVVDSARAKFDQVSSEMGRIDTSVDPGRFWATRSTGDKVIGIMGLVLGALGAGPDGVNRAAVMLNDAVGRDLEAQKAEHELRLKKGGARVQAAQNFYSMAREAAGDELGAMDLAHVAALKQVAAKGRQMMASTQDAAARARLAEMVAAIEQGIATRQQQGWEKAQDRYLERMKIAAAHGKDGTATKDLRNAVANYSTIEQTIGDLKDLIGDTNFVTEKVGDKAARMETLAASLLTKIKEQEKLGTLDKGVSEMAERLIGDPSATFTLDSAKIAKLDTLLQQSRRDVQNLAGAMR